MLQFVTNNITLNKMKESDSFVAIACLDTLILLSCLAQLLTENQIKITERTVTPAL